jgi:hypothetical protein
VEERKRKWKKENESEDRTVSGWKTVSGIERILSKIRRKVE